MTPIRTDCKPRANNRLFGLNKRFPVVAVDGGNSLPPGVYPGRPPHIHFKVSVPGHKPLTTQCPHDNTSSRP